MYKSYAVVFRNISESWYNCTIDSSYVFGSYHVSVKGCDTSSFLDNGILKQLLKNKCQKNSDPVTFYFFVRKQ